MVARRSVCAFVLAIGWLHAAGGEPGRVSNPSVTIERQGDRMTVRISHAPLSQVLAELHRQAGIQSEFIASANDETVSQRFEAMPLIEAIGRLLNGRSFAIVHGSPPPAVGSNSLPMLQLLILPDTVPRSQAVTTSLSAGPTALPTDLVQRSVAGTALTAETLPAGSDHVASPLDQFTQAMVDPDESVRALAQEQFEQALTTPNTSAVVTPQPPR